MKFKNFRDYFKMRVNQDVAAFVDYILEMSLGRQRIHSGPHPAHWAQLGACSNNWVVQVQKHRTGIS